MKRGINTLRILWLNLRSHNKEWFIDRYNLTEEEFNSLLTNLKDK